MRSWEEALQAEDAELVGWAEAQPWAREMASCPQDREWHAEGDVWTHTKMVCDALRELGEWRQLDRSAQLKVFFGALFHDSGKPTTTALDPDSGRLRSPKHALLGATVARRALADLGCDLATREEIATLVRYHSRPPHVDERPSPERDVISLSWQLTNRLLYLLACADTAGRKTGSSGDAFERINLWRNLAEEQECFEAPFPFANDKARVLFFRGQLPDLKYVPHESYRSRVILMSGLPGAGKDTWLQKNRPELSVVSLDDLRRDLEIDPEDDQGVVVQGARERCREYLRKPADFALSCTNVSRRQRAHWIALFTDYDARVEIVYIEPPFAKILGNNRQRPRPVPGKVIERLWERLEPPQITECHGLVLSSGAR